MQQEPITQAALAEAVHPDAPVPPAPQARPHRDPPLDPQRLRAERMRMLGRQARSGSAAATIGVTVLSALVVPTAGWLFYMGWVTVVMVGFLLRNRTVERCIAREEFTPRSERVVAGASAAISLLVGAPALLFFTTMGPELRGLFTAVQVGWVSLAGVVLGLYVRAYALYVIVSFTLLSVGWAAATGWKTGLVVAAMLVSATVVLVRFAQRVSAVFDESVRMRFENEQLVVRLTEALAQTAQAQQARSRFLAAASHDLLQPVHALMLLVGVLRESSSAQAKEQAALRIELTASSIASMFRGLLDQARLDAGAVTPRLATVALAEVCRGIEAAYVTRCSAAGLGLVVECAPDLAARADPALLDRVLRNLVDNAVKFTTRGEVTLRVERDGDAIVVSVSDTGPGIAPEDQARIFEPFYRGHSAQATAVEGVGLGLANAAQMTALMGGTVRLHTSGPGGTRVDVMLPRVALDPQDAATLSAGDDVGLAYRRVLVVEDDRQAREALRLWLIDHRCEAVCAESLADALARCEDLGFVPDIVLSDMRLTPGPDGLQTIAALRTRFPDVPAALITGEPLERDSVPPGIGLLHKPVKLAQLERLLRGRTATGGSHDLV